MKQKGTTPVPAVALPLYPTMTSLQQVINYANSKLPITDKNTLLSVLSIYHNTLLNQVQLCKKPPTTEYAFFDRPENTSPTGK